MTNAILIIPWVALFYPIPSGSTPISINSPVLREIERKKSLYYYNTAPMRPPISELKRRRSNVQETPAEDKLYIKPYKFPFWGLPFGIYSKGGFFNPGLFPFVPGGPGFPPFDGIFGGVPTDAPFTTPTPPPPPSTKAPPPVPPSYGQYYYPRRRPPKKKKPPTKQPAYQECDCDEEDEEYDSDCNCPPSSSSYYNRRKEMLRRSPQPTYSRRPPYRRPKISTTESPYHVYRRKSSYPSPTSANNSKMACRYGYNSGPQGGCKPPPITRQRYYETIEDKVPYSRRSPPTPRYRFKRPRPTPKPEPPEEEYYEDTDEDDEEEDEPIPQYIPVYFPYPSQQSYESPESSTNQPQMTTPSHPTTTTTAPETTSVPTSTTPFPIPPQHYHNHEAFVQESYQAAPTLVSQSPQIISHSHTAPSQPTSYQNAIQYPQPIPVNHPHQMIYNYVASSSNSNLDKNLRAINSEDPFISNILNNYTASSLQMQANNHNKSQQKGALYNHRTQDVEEEHEDV